MFASFNFSKINLQIGKNAFQVTKNFCSVLKQILQQNYATGGVHRLRLNLI